MIQKIMLGDDPKQSLLTFEGKVQGGVLTVEAKSEILPKLFSNLSHGEHMEGPTPGMRVWGPFVRGVTIPNLTFDFSNQKMWDNPLHPLPGGSVRAQGVWLLDTMLHKGLIFQFSNPNYFATADTLTLYSTTLQAGVISLYDMYLKKLHKSWELSLSMVVK